MMDWTNIKVRIDWKRCGRRRWPNTPKLAFTPQESQKRRNVLLYWWVGKGQRLLPEGPVPIMPGICHWARPGWTYSCTQRPDNPLGVTAIHFDLLDQSGKVIGPESGKLPPEQLVVNDSGLVEHVTQWIAERAMNIRSGIPIDQQTQDIAEQMLRALLMELDHATSQSARSLKPVALAGWRELTSYIQRQLHNLPPVDELASRSGYTRSHFSRAFRAQTGLSPKEYIINARTSLSKELLRSTGLSITQIAERTGYSDVYTFSKQFKHMTGLTPTEYRRETTGL